MAKNANENVDIVVGAAAPVEAPAVDAVPEAPKPPYDPMKDIRPYVVQRAKPGEQQTFYISINGKTYAGPRGVTVMLPRPFIEYLEMTERNEARLQDKIEELNATTLGKQQYL